MKTLEINFPNQVESGQYRTRVKRLKIGEITDEKNNGLNHQMARISRKFTGTIFHWRKKIVTKDGAMKTKLQCMNST